MAFGYPEAVRLDLDTVKQFYLHDHRLNSLAYSAWH